MGFGDGYRYAHDEPGAYAAGQRYMPADLDTYPH
jgi:putative ATPase